MENITRVTTGRLRSNLYWNTLLRVPTRIISFAVSILVARILMPRDFGIIAVVMMLIGYANIFTNLGFMQAIVQKDVRGPKTLGSMFTADLLISTILAALFFFTSGYISEFFNTPESAKVIRVMSPVFIITSFYAIAHGILRRDMRFKVFAMLEACQSILMSLMTLLLARMGYGYWALAYGQLVPLVFMTIIFCIAAGWTPKITYNHRLMEKIYHFGIWNFIRSQVNFGAVMIDKFVIGKWLGPVSLGLYDKAKSIGGIPVDSILININSVLFSSFSKMRENTQEIKVSIDKSLTLMSIIILPIYTGLILIAPHFVHVCLGEKWKAMIVPFRIILFGFLIKSFTVFTSTFNVSVGNYKAHTIRTSIATFIFLLSCLALVRFGLNSVCRSFVIYSSVAFLLDSQLIIKYYNISWLHYIRPILSGLAPTFLMMVVVAVLARNIFARYSATNMVFLCFIGSTVYMACIILSGDSRIREIRRMVMTDLLHVTHT